MKNSSFIARLFAALCFSVLIFSAANSVSAQTTSIAANRQLEFWKTFSPDGGRFKVAAPREMVALEVPAEFAEGVNLKVYQAGLRSEAYTIAYVDYPVDEKIIDLLKDNWEELWRKFGEGVGKNANRGSFLISDKNITKGNIAGREVVIEGNAIVYHVRFFLVGKRFYAVEMQTPVMRNAPATLVQIYQAEADKFFNSFQILDNKTQVAEKVTVKGKIR